MELLSSICILNWISDLAKLQETWDSTPEKKKKKKDNASHWTKMQTNSEIRKHLKHTPNLFVQ